MKRIVFASFMLVAGMATLPVRADLMISYTADGSPGAFLVNVGQQVEIPLFILETGDTTRLRDFGLFSAGVTVSVEPSARFSKLTDADLASHWAPSGTLGSIATFDAVSGVAILTAAVNVGTAGIFPATGMNSVRIGTLTFEGVAPGMAMLASGDPSTKKNVISNGVNLDPDVFGTSTQATVTTVPEPGTLVMGLLGIASVGGIALLRRRRQRQAVIN